MALPDETARGVQQLDAGGRSAFLGIAEELGITDRGKIEVRGLGLA